MRIIEQTRLEVVENHLLRLGAGNHPDNLARLRRIEFHCSVELTEDDFFGLVFLQNTEVLRIAPRGADRTLRTIAMRAVDLGHPTLSGNWDLAENLRRMRGKLGGANIFLEPLVICESRDGEQQFGPFYLQDGSHRALACATLILLNEAQYERQIAFCSMSKRVRQSL
jgi:hypothetical protein